MSPKQQPAGTNGPISRDDIEAKLRGIQGQVSNVASDSSDKLQKIVIAAAGVALLLVFVIGRKSGTKKTTVVEIRRV